jgi:hypothetical protein
VRELLFAGGLLHGLIGTNDQTSVWRDAATKLRVDPQAEVEIADPPPPAPRPSVNYQLPTSYPIWVPGSSSRRSSSSAS